MQNALTYSSLLLHRLLQLNPNLQDTFPSFKGVALDELMNSRSLFLHSKRLMEALEIAISSLDDGQDFAEYFTYLGERHAAISITENHFKVGLCSLMFREKKNCYDVSRPSFLLGLIANEVRMRSRQKILTLFWQ